MLVSEDGLTIFFKFSLGILSDSSQDGHCVTFYFWGFLVNETASSADLLLSEWHGHGVCQTCKILK